MAASSNFHGLRMSIKVAFQTIGQLMIEAKDTGSNREYVARSWLENWRTLAGIPPFIYQRLIAHAAAKKVTLKDIVNEALIQYASKLPDPPSAVPSPIDILEEAKIDSLLKNMSKADDDDDAEKPRKRKT